MKIIKVNNYEELSQKACEFLIKEIPKNKKFILGFATGKSVLGTYKLLVKKFKEGKIDFSKIISFNLDEYFPIKKKNKNSFYFYMHKNLFDKINILKKNINLFNGETKNPKKECLNYERKLKKNKIDLQILGLGGNGHIGYNEPGSKINSEVRLINLNEKTLKDKSKNFKNGKMPSRAFTIGIKNILDSKKILLIVSGKNKKVAFEHLIRGKISLDWPVSFLKKHKNLTVIVNKKIFN